MEVQVQRGDVLLRSEKVWEFFTRHGGEEGHTLQCGVVALVESYCATMTSALERLDMSDGQRREASALLEYMQGMDRRQQAAQESERGAVAECVGTAVGAASERLSARLEEVGRRVAGMENQVQSQMMDLIRVVDNAVTSAMARLDSGHIATLVSDAVHSWMSVELQGVKDGHDESLACLETRLREVFLAGAVTPLTARQDAMHSLLLTMPQEIAAASAAMAAMTSAARHDGQARLQDRLDEVRRRLDAGLEQQGRDVLELRGKLEGMCTSVTQVITDAGSQSSAVARVPMLERCLDQGGAGVAQGGAAGPGGAQPAAEGGKEHGGEQ